MKKVFILFIVSVFVFLSGCKNDEQHSTAEPITRYDNETVIYYDENNGIVVKDKKLSFEGNDLMVLNVKNSTEKNFSITVTGIYYDEYGKELLSETQCFDQVSSDHEHYFLFYPEIVFTEFIYSFDIQQSDAQMYINDVEFVFSGLEETEWPVDELEKQGDRTFHPVIISLFGYKNISKDDSLVLNVGGKVILFNEKNEIIAIYPMTSCIQNNEEVDYTTKQIYYTTEKELIWPEKFQGEIKALHATTKCEKYN